MRKSDARTIIVHRKIQREKYFQSQYHHLAKDLEEKRSAIRLKDITQVTFLRREFPNIPSSSTLRKELRDKDILATCVVVTFIPKRGRRRSPKSYVYEAVVRMQRPRISWTPQRFPHNYTHVRSILEIKVLGREFEIPGSYFVQENGIDCVCAQACIKMSMIHIDGDVQRVPPTSGRINEIVRCYRRQKQLEKLNPRRGLTIGDLREVIHKEHGHALLLDTKKDRWTPPYEFTYLLIESGIPALVAFCPEPVRAGEDPPEPEILHVMPVVGHTMNCDRWLPIAKIHYEEFDVAENRDRHAYRSTAEWACHLVIHDDCLGPYYCLGEHDLLYPPNRRGKRKSRIRFVIGLVPDDAGFSKKMTPYLAQQAACEQFWSSWRTFLNGAPEPWRTRFVAFPFTPNTLVLRTQLVKQADYIGHLSHRRSNVDHMGKAPRLGKDDTNRLRRELPERFWVTEFTLSEIYSVNQNAFGEILIEFSPSSKDLVSDELWPTLRPSPSPCSL